MSLVDVRPAGGARRVPQLDSFRARCETVAGRDLGTVPALHEFSVTRFRDFWREFLDWSGLAWSGYPEPVCTSDDVRQARFFPGVRLNYAENLLRPLAGAGDDAPALTSVHDGGRTERWTRGELRAAVERTVSRLRGHGVREGDRVIAVAANHGDMVVASLAVAALGATLSTATPDMGPSTLLGRFGQVRPVAALIDRTGMDGNGRAADDVLATLVEGLPSLRAVLVLDDRALPEFDGVQVVRLADLPAEAAGDAWPRLSFDHPLWVMFSSGTTGPPKAMVHGAGGSLLEHVKEHRLHGDLGPGDTLYFHTTTAWMMWNWQLSALAVGAHIVVYDGAVSGPETLWELVATHRVTVFGTSPAYLQMCEDEGYRPRSAGDLGSLRAVLSTGAVLHDWQFDWLADALGPVPVQSISGGTDIVGCFVLGHPEQPVRRGWCQSLGLGLDVCALEDGLPVRDRVGELVCRRPFPSRPVGFLDDPDGERFRLAYFAENPGSWTHGDRIEIADDGSARMHGRSDGVLNVNGIRIGPSEIYRIVRAVPGVLDAMAVEQRDPANRGSSRLVLLVVLAAGVRLDPEFAAGLRATLRREGSPAHVPSVILAVPDLPTTHNGKRSESAARAVLDGEPVRNSAALRNPDCLAALAEAAARQLSPGTSEPAPARPADREDDVRAVVARVFAEVLSFPVSDTLSFFDAGGTSRQVMALLRRLRMELRRPVLMQAFLEAPTVEGVTAAIRTGPRETPPVELLRSGKSGEPPLYLVHGYQGDVDLYRSLVVHLDTPAPVYGLTNDPSFAEQPGATVASIAGQHVRTLQSHSPVGPVRLAGFSLGGLLAFEMARQLAALGRTVSFLGLLDVEPPGAPAPAWSNRLRRWASKLAWFVPGVGTESIADILRRRRDRRRAAGPASAVGAEPVNRAMEGAYRIHAGYWWGPYDGPVTYFRARRRIPVILNRLYEWRRVVRDLTVVPVPGSHGDLLSGEHAPTLAGRFSEALRSS